MWLWLMKITPYKLWNVLICRMFVCLYDNKFCTSLVPAGSPSSSPGFVALTDACYTHPQPHTTLINGKQTNKRKATNSQTLDYAYSSTLFSPYNFAMPLQGIDLCEWMATLSDSKEEQIVLWIGHPWDGGACWSDYTPQPLLRPSPDHPSYARAKD